MDLLIYGPAIFAGIIGSRYLNRLANFCLMVAVFQLDLAILVSVMSGELRLRLLMPYTVVAIIPAMAGIIGGSNSEVNVSGQDFITKSSPFQPLSWHRIQLQPSPSVKGLALSRR